MNSKVAINTMLGLLGAVILFHVCIITKIISYKIIWGGRIDNDPEMYIFELISIAINLLLFSTLLIKGKYIRQILTEKLVNIILWIFLIIFGLNTIGNVMAETTFEKLFALLTFTSSFLIWKILRKSKKKDFVTVYKRMDRT